MFHILGFIFLIILVILIIGLSIIAAVVRKLFNMGSRTAPNQKQNTWQTTQDSYADESEEKKSHPHSRRKKIFDDDEGEYVDFEEIKPGSE